MVLTEIKNWYLILDTFTKNDYIWITSIGCNITVTPPLTQTVNLLNGTTIHYVTEAPRIEIETTCKQQQSMLQLKYGDLLYLKNMYYE